LSCEKFYNIGPWLQLIWVWEKSGDADDSLSKASEVASSKVSGSAGSS